MALTAVGLAACSAAEPTKPSWSCAEVRVPNGTAVECVASGPAALTSYTCPSPTNNNPDCPPIDVIVRPPSTDGLADPGPGTPDDTGGGAPVTEGSGSGGASDGGAGATPDAGIPAEDCGTGDKPVGNGNGNGGGNGNGNGGGKPSTSGGGSGDGTGGGDAGGGGGGGGGADAGRGSGGGPHDGHYDCESDGSRRVCRDRPTCTAGTHPSPCGACVPDGEPRDCSPPKLGGCWVTGGGFIDTPDGKDSFGGNGMPMKDGSVRGVWEHQDHGSGAKLHAQVSYLFCRHVDAPGPGQPGGKKGFDVNQAYFGGPARWFSGGAWADGYWFDAMALDHGEPGSLPPGKNGKTPDHYRIVVRKYASATQSGPIVYQAEADFSGGNFQIHPPNAGHPYTSSSVPGWVSLVY